MKIMIMIVLFFTLALAQVNQLEEKKAALLAERTQLIEYNQKLIEENQRVLIEISNISYAISMIDSMLAK